MHHDGFGGIAAALRHPGKPPGLDDQQDIRRRPAGRRAVREEKDLLRRIAGLFHKLPSGRVRKRFAALALAAPAVASPSAPASAKADSESDLAVIGAAAIRKKTLELLNSGRSSEAAAMAMHLVAAAPSDAFSYLCLGAAHQTQGNIAAAATAYRTCIAYAKHGDVDECRALAH